eukprot:9753418-Prorocentrum_lima.AAC.1
MKVVGVQCFTCKRSFGNRWQHLGHLKRGPLGCRLAFWCLPTMPPEQMEAEKQMDAQRAKQNRKEGLHPCA